MCRGSHQRQRRLLPDARRHWYVNAQGPSRRMSTVHDLPSIGCIVGLLLHYLRESEVFHVASFLLRQSAQSSSEAPTALSFLQDREPQRFVCTNYKSMQLLLFTFGDLVKRRLRVLAARTCIHSLSLSLVLSLTSSDVHRNARTRLTSGRVCCKLVLAPIRISSAVDGVYKA